MLPGEAMSNYCLFHWQAIDPDGLHCQGDMLADNPRQLQEMMFRQGLLPLKITRKKCYSSRYWLRQERIVFFSQTGMLLQAGLPLSEGLLLLAGGHPAKAWRSLLEQLQQQILSGISFSSALSHWPGIFPPLCIAMIRTGEQTGQLEYCCKNLAAQQQKQRQLKQQLIKALRYPLFVLLLSAVISFGLLLWILPEFAAIYRSAISPLPAFTRCLFGFSQSLLHSLPLVLMMVMAGCLGVLRCKKKPARVLAGQRFLLRLPLAGRLWQFTILAQLFDILALTQRSGLPLSEGLQIAENVFATPFWQQALTTLRHHIEQGFPLSAGLNDQPGFPPICYLLARSGEQTGTLDVVFMRLARWFETEASQQTDLLSNSIEPAMLLITGLITGSIVIGMYLPMFNPGEVIF